MDGEKVDKLENANVNLNAVEIELEHDEIELDHDEKKLEKLDTLKSIEWSTKMMEILHGNSGTWSCRCWPGFHPFVRVQLLRTEEVFETLPIHYASNDFRFEDEHDPTQKFCIPKNMDIADCEIRGIILDSYFTKDNVLGWCNAPLQFLEEHQNKKTFLKLITEEETSFTGNLYLELCYCPEDRTLEVKVLGCKSVPIKQRFLDLTHLWGFLGILCYTLINAAIMHGLQKENCPGFDDFSKVMWFTIVTFGSVGYGDMYPCTDSGRVMNSFLILINQVTIACFFNVVLRFMLIQYRIIENYETKLYNYFKTESDEPKFKVGQTVLVQDVNGDRCKANIMRIKTTTNENQGTNGTKVTYTYDMQWVMGEDADFFTRKEPQIKKIDPLTFKKLWKRFLTQLFYTSIILCLVILFGTLVFRALEREEYASANDDELSYAKTFHFCVVTMATVGYGDWAPGTAAGMTFGSFFLLGGVVLLAYFASIGINFYLKHEQLKNSTAFLNESLVTPEQLLDFDMNGDREINKYEYLTKSLLACKFVDEDKIDMIMNKFMDIDTDKSGVITVEDFIEYQKESGTTGESQQSNLVFFYEVFREMLADTVTFGHKET